MTQENNGITQPIDAAPPSDLYKYSNNGLNMSMVSPDYVAQPGEVLFSDYATTGELIEAFPASQSAIGYTAALALQNKTNANSVIQAQIDALAVQLQVPSAAYAIANSTSNTANANAALASMQSIMTQIDSLQAQIQT